MKHDALRRIAEDRGWHIVSLYQPQHLFRRDGRRHSRVAAPGDPWLASVADKPNVLFATAVHTATGDTASDAVRAAIPSNLQESLRRCGEAVDSLRDCLQK